MYLKSLELSGFKSFAKKSALGFQTPITAIVGPNGSGKSNTAEAFRFVLGEQSLKSMRGKKGEDLIWNGTQMVPRANRAGVKLVFDNQKRLLNVDFDEVSIERAVYRDGTNEYSINGSKVRLRDVVELLAGANIGSSGHHIISQGEADRVLSASPKERRAMIEDALGLRIYQYRKIESEKKLTQTEENKKQVEALRRENAPHLKFLERQMEKLARARELREQLISAYREYLRRESAYLDTQEELIAGERSAPAARLSALDSELMEVRETLERTKKDDSESTELLEIERGIARIREQKTATERSLGRLEGQIAFEERHLEEEKRRLESEEDKPVPFRALRALSNDLTALFDSSDSAQDVSAVRDYVKKMRSLVSDFIEQNRPKAGIDVSSLDQSELSRLTEEKRNLEHELAALSSDEKSHDEKYRALQKEIEQVRDESRDAEREMFKIMAEQNALRAAIAEIDARARTLSRDREEFKRELGEAGALIGREALSYKEFEPTDASGVPVSLEELQAEDRTAQEARRRDLEKMKIRLEEIGGGNAEEVTKEYDETKERDAFLEREIQDLVNSTESLRSLIADLERELDEKFRLGLESISKQFNEFFMLMFGGGEASLMLVKSERKRRTGSDLLGLDGEEGVVEEEEDVEEGIDIQVSLPHKRIKGLMMLSGGERALTSIALIFAMAAVNAPSFIILDETDAALDEANSRRYGDMIEGLSGKSQLILITHNRETMSRAGVLYGVTMGADGASKLLSVKFEEAVAVAK